MHWSESRKSYKSPDNLSTAGQRYTSAFVVTPPKIQKERTFQSYTSNKQQKSNSMKQCPYHFNKPTHVCLTCRKSICLRCALTYCQQHSMYSQEEIIPQLKKDLVQFHVQPKIQEIEVKLNQSQQRQNYLQRKISKLVQNIQDNFDYIASILQKKKIQIIQYYQQEFQKYLTQYQKHDQQLKQNIHWLQQVLSNYLPTQKLPENLLLLSIEEIDSVAMEVRKVISPENKTEKKMTKMLMGKEKLKIDKMWAEENLEKVLFEIQNINYRMENIQNTKHQKRKKRVTTENVFETKNNPFTGLMKSSSNSRIPSGRKGQS